MASDGSVIYQQGTFGYIWKDNKGLTIKEGNGSVWGNVNRMSSYRAEAQGVSDCIADVPEQQLRGVTIWIDNHGLVNCLNQKYPLNPLKAEWDLVKPT